ncbi:MAG: hypothetical protein QM736_25355 [Vicinamibacterales bacterium]
MVSTRSRAVRTTAPTLRFPACCTVWSVRSPHAHARIVSIDTSAALKVPGVKGVVTGRDVPLIDAKLGMGEGAMDLKDMSDNLLARAKALYHGHAVAAVAATTLAAADAKRPLS